MSRCPVCVDEPAGERGICAYCLAALTLIKFRRTAVYGMQAYLEQLEK